MSIFMDAALAYRQRGWSVFPIHPRTKKPIVRWSEYQHRLPTEQEIKKWWKDRPNANIGIITGRISDLVVLDVDTKRGGDAKQIHESCPTPFIARTGGGGYHLYYRFPSSGDYRNSTGSDGVDVRAEGGYVVAPPSRHRSGNPYEWAQADESRKPGRAPTAFLKQRLHERNGTSPREPWMRDLLQGVDQGQRNEACSRLAGYYINKMSTSATIDTLLAWNKLNSPPLLESEIKTVVESVRRTQRRREPNIIPVHKIGEDELLSLTPLKQFMAKFGDVSVDWLVENWLPDRTIGMFVAAPGSYKTWMLLDIAVSVATGTPMFGQLPVARAGPVLVFQQEDWHGSVAQRIALIACNRLGIKQAKQKPRPDDFRFSIPPDIPIYFHENRQFRFDNEEAMIMLAERVEQIEPRLVILDPLYSAGGTEDFMASMANSMFVLKDLRDEYGCSFILAHHTKKINSNLPIRRKGEPLQIERQDLWGSQFLNAFIETGWQVRRDDMPHTLQIQRHFKVQEDAPRCTMEFNINTKTAFTYAVKIRESKPTDDTTPGILSVIDDHGPQTAPQLAKLMDMHRSTISRQIRKLVEAGELAKSAEGIYSITGDMTS